MRQEDALEQGSTIVVDIGKTLGKVSLWSDDGRMLDRQTRANERKVDAGITRLDADGIGNWLIEALRVYAGEDVRAIVPVAHGAGVVAMHDDKLAFAPFDYEAEPPREIMSTYRDQREPFAVTGSPALPAGLNLGLQLHWAEICHSDAMANATLVPWAQYWAWFLTGKAMSEVSSLGCHTDLWLPAQGRFSAMAENRGWARKFAPLAKAGDVVGGLKDSIALASGLRAGIPVLAGLHDSNAALLAARGYEEIAQEDATILSTGTWFIAMRLAKDAMGMESLPEGRDCLVNVDVEGRMVPSARFMGGREIETLIGIDTRQVDIKPDQPALIAAVEKVVADETMVLPSIAAGSGPYPRQRGGWQNEPTDPVARRTAACLYAALMTDRMLDLIGSRETLLVEGRFGEAEVFVRGLAALRPDMTVLVANEHNDVAMGALRLIDPALRPAGSLRHIEPLDSDLAAYRAKWLDELEAFQ